MPFLDVLRRARSASSSISHNVDARKHLNNRKHCPIELYHVLKCRHSRVVKIESKLDGILALLGQQNSTSEAPDSPTGSPVEDLDEDLIQDFDDPLSQAPASIISEIQHLNQHSFDDTLPDFNYDESISSLTSPSAVGSSTDFLVAGIMTPSHAEKFLGYFRGSMNSYFPFVIIPKDATAEGMFQKRPILLLGILATATSMYKPLQRLLDQKFRSVLSERAVFHGEKSLDLLQGLLVYLSWYGSGLRGQEEMRTGINEI